MEILSAPATLWELYVHYLCKAEPGSWVNSTASTFRILAFLIAVPCILLMLLDVTSYVIARTLGVIDDTKAATSEPVLLGGGGDEPDTPTIAIHDDSTPESPPLSTPPLAYFSNPTEEEGNLRLSGVGTFSPAPSQPPSPTLARRELAHHAHYPAAVHLPAPQERDGAADSPGSDESYTLLERDAAFDDDAAVTLRRRARPGPGAQAQTGTDAAS